MNILPLPHFYLNKIDFIINHPDFIFSFDHPVSCAVEVPALIDSGCDITVIPENLARVIGLNLQGKKEKLYAFRESSEAIQSKVSMTFMGKAHRQNVSITIPVLVVLTKGDDEEGVVLGVQGVFDAFEITFRKVENEIKMKPAKGKLFSLF